MSGTGMSICNVYSFSICPSQTITPFNYGSQNYSCNNTNQPDVAFNIMGGGWRVNKFGWFFSANVGGQITGYSSSGVLQIIPFAATNTITPLSYSGNYVQLAINGVSTGTLLSQSNFSISLSSSVFTGNTFTYCPNTTTNIAISPVSPTQGGPWTYNWQPGGLTGNPVNVGPTSSTIYTVTAHTTAGCNSTTTVTVNINCCTLLLTPSISVIDASCTSATGSVTINSITNGTSNYTITEASSTIATNVTLPYTVTVVTVGTHTFGVLSANGCSTTFTANIQQAGLPPNLSVTSPVMLNCMQSTTLNATSTSNPISYSWTGSAILTGAQTQSPTVNQIGDYTITVTQGSCSNTAVVSVISNSNIPSITITPTLSTICSGQSTTLTASGANTYTWSSSPTLSTTSGNSVVASPIATTVYTVIGTYNSCTNSAVATVSVLSNPTLTVSPNVSICQGVSSSATLTVTGANTYTWVNSTTLSSSTGSIVVASPNATTIYTVTGTTASCSNTAVVTVSVNPSPTITAVSFTNTSCGLNNGSIVVTSSPANNTYTWSGGITSTTNTASSLAASNYSVTAVNGSCQTTTVATILSSMPLLITSSTVIPSDCNLNNGSIIVIDNNANSNYSWSPNVSSTNTANNLPASNYALTITNGACSTSTIIVVPQLNGPTSLNVVQSDAICESVNGSINILNVVNGTAPYQYNFNNTGFSTVSSYLNLAQGSYTITVKDAHGCLYDQIFWIDKSIINLTLDLITTSPACDDNDGSYIINSVTSGTPPYLTSFNNGTYSGNLIFNQLSIGTYSLSIRDSNMCETGYVLTMQENGDYTLYIPNTFTPNNNIVNDIWYVKGTCINQFNCIIYNRWGEKIKELKDMSEGWDGTYNGAPVPDGVYVYLLEVETQNGTINKAGHITVFR